MIRRFASSITGICLRTMLAFFMLAFFAFSCSEKEGSSVNKETMQLSLEASAKTGSMLPSKSKLTSKAKIFCSSCHAFVSPDAFPREYWAPIIVQMYRLAGSKASVPGFEKREDFDMMLKNTSYRLPSSMIPDQKKVIEYYMSNAKPEHEFKKRYKNEKYEVSAEFFKSKKIAPLTSYEPPAVSEIKEIRGWTNSHGRQMDGFLMSDLLSGQLVFQSKDLKFTEKIGELTHATHFEVIDLDRNGRLDLLVTDLGELQTVDTDKGALIAFLNIKGQGFVKIPVLRGLGRTAHVDILYKKDGGVDIALSVFGMYSSGKVILLENFSFDRASRSFRFSERLLDKRQGAIKSKLVDFNGDGLVDVVSLLSQHTEKIVLYLKTKDGGYRIESLASAALPSFGSSGMELFDFDRDGDLDIFWLNGDIMDNFVVQKKQGIYYLENLGGLKFKKSFLGEFPGIHDLKIDDLDGDGDFDLFGVSALTIMGEPVGPKDSVSAAWFENESGVFSKRPLILNQSRFFSALISDLDSDGKKDLLVGNSFLGFADEPAKSDLKWLLPFISIKNSPKQQKDSGNLKK